MMPFQICSRDSFPLPSSISLSLFPSLHLRKSVERALATGVAGITTLASHFFSPFFFFLLLPFLSFLFVTAQTILERRCMDIFFSERHSRILRGCEMNSRARIERATMLHVAAFLSKAHMLYVMCGVSLFS